MRRTGEGTVRELGMDRYTVLYLKWITNKDLLYSIANCVQCYVAAWMGGDIEGEWIQVYVWFESLLSTWNYHNIANWLWKKESEVTQLCPTPCDPTDCSLPGSSVHGVFQARVLEWVASSFSRGSSRPRDWTQVSHTVGRCFTIWATRKLKCPTLWPHGLYSPWNSPSQSIGVGSLSLLHGIFPT